MSSDSRILATYRVESAHPIEEAARSMAEEQSSGTFVTVPDETEALRERHAARVEATTMLGSVSAPTLPGSEPPEEAPEGGARRRAEVKISYPIENVGHSLPQLMTTVAGNLFELQPLSGVKLTELSMPETFAAEFPGPQFGIDGTREIVDVYERPIIGTIIKPSVGLRPEETASIAENVVNAGVDFIKDDELIADPPYSPVSKRVESVLEVIDRHEHETGESVMYACNITGTVDEMLERHDAVKDAGGNCIMVSLQSVGLSAVQKLRAEADLPIHGHRNGWGALSRCRQLGFNYEVWQQFWRLAGVDHLHVSGLQNKFTESDESVISSARAVQRPIGTTQDVAMPVFSSGQWAGQAPATYEAMGNCDLMYLAGGGILGHPDGPRAGVAHLKQGWEAAMSDTTLEAYAANHEELRTAMEYYDR